MSAMSAIAGNSMVFRLIFSLSRSTCSTGKYICRVPNYRFSGGWRGLVGRGSHYRLQIGQLYPSTRSHTRQYPQRPEILCLPSPPNPPKRQQRKFYRWKDDDTIDKTATTRIYPLNPMRSLPTRRDLVRDKKRLSPRPKISSSTSCALSLLRNQSQPAKHHQPLLPSLPPFPFPPIPSQVSLPYPSCCSYSQTVGVRSSMSNKQMRG